jgi:hypothetical protein
MGYEVDTMQHMATQVDIRIRLGPRQESIERIPSGQRPIQAQLVNLDNVRYLNAAFSTNIK